EAGQPGPVTAALRSDPRPEVRAAAARAARAVRSVEAVPGLIAALDDGDREVRAAAALALEPILGITLVNEYRPDDPPDRRRREMAKLTQFFQTPGRKEHLLRYHAAHPPPNLEAHP